MKNELTRLKRLLMVCLYSCMLWLSGCDGGIFGTGGDQVAVENIPDNAAESNAGDGSSPATEPPITGTPPDVSTDPAGSADNGAARQIRPFENLLAGTLRDEPLISVINVSRHSVLLRLDQDAQQTMISAGASVSGIVASPTSTILEVLGERLNNSPAPGVVFNPLNLGMSSLTTLIVRNGSAADDTSVFDVVPIRSLAQSGDAALSNITLVQAIELDDTDTAARFELQPGGDNPGSATIRFDALNYSTASSGPMSTPAGDYQLTDPRGRFAPQPLSLTGGSNYVIVITGGGAVVRVELVSAVNSPVR